MPQSFLHLSNESATFSSSFFTEHASCNMLMNTINMIASSTAKLMKIFSINYSY